MKKLFTLLAVVVSTFCGMAQTTTDYSCALAVLVDGSPADPQQKTVTTVEDNGKYTLELKNFVLYSQGEPMPVGTITVKDIEGVDDNGTIVLKTTQNITIDSGDDANFPFWMGPLLGTVPINLEGKVVDGLLSAILDIPFGEMSISVYVNSATTQVGNSGFETWHIATAGKATSDEPNQWHSFMSCAGSMASIVSGTPHAFKSTDVRPGSTGTTSVELKSSAIMGQSANGTLTTGRLYAGSITASSTDNHSALDLSDTATDGNGDPFYTKIEGCPDSLVVWLKFHPGANNSNPQALVSAILTDGTYYQDPEDTKTTYNNIVAKAYNKTIESNNEQWQRISIPFDYETYRSNNVSPRVLLVTISTCATPGGGSKSNSDPDVLTIDDFSLVYSSKLNSISVGGTPIEGFKGDVYEYEMNVTSLPAAEDITFDKENENAIVNITMDGNTAYIVTIANDLKNITQYSVTFKVTGTDGIENTDANATNTVTGTYGIDGKRLPAGTKAPIIIKRYSDGTSRKVTR